MHPLLSLSPPCPLQPPSSLGATATTTFWHRCGHCSGQDWGKVSGYPASVPDGHSGGIRGDGHCNAAAAGEMSEVSAWESEVESAMREMARRVDEEDS